MPRRAKTMPPTPLPQPISTTRMAKGACRVIASTNRTLSGPRNIASLLVVGKAEWANSKPSTDEKRTVERHKSLLGARSSTSAARISSEHVRGQNGGRERSTPAEDITQ